VRDRTKIAVLVVGTVPLAWVALAGGSDAPSARPEAASDQVARSSPGAASDAGASGGPAPAAVASAAAPPPAPSPSAEPPVVAQGTGQLVIVPGGIPAGPGSPGAVTRRYTVSVEGGLGVEPAAFAAEVDRTLADPRSWGHDGRLAFRRVDSGPVHVRVVLASPATTDRLCHPLRTQGRYSCGAGATAVLNSMRWLRGADAYAGRLPEYRQYVVNHEVGHTLGHGHEGCPAPARPAPVMMQQTKGVGACLPSPWPYP